MSVVLESHLCFEGHISVYPVAPNMPFIFQNVYYLNLKIDNIKISIQEVGCGGMDWIGLAQDRDRWRTLVNAQMNIRVP